ncbi:MAG: GNAT family N-acetyltransferase [Pseudomonadota bacterium]
MHAPLAPKLRTEWQAFETLSSIAQEWRSLAARALEPNVFYDPAFALAAAPVFGKGVGATLVWSASGRLMGLFPGHAGRNHAGIQTATIGWTHPYAPLGVPLVDRDESEAVIAAWLDQIGQNNGLLALSYIPEHGPFSRALDAVLKRTGRRDAAFGHHERALLDPGAERAGYLDRAVSSSKRKEIRRQRRRLEEVAPVTFATITEAQDIGAALKDFLVLEASGWKGLAGTAAANDPAIRSFMESAVSGLAARAQARVDRMSLNGQPIAVCVTLMSGDTAWCWKIAYSEGVARYSPGVQLVFDLTANLLADQTVARTDSCATAGHPMIDHIWSERLAVSDRLIEVKPQAIPFGLTCRLEELRRTAIAQAKSLRDKLRR